MMSRVSHRFTLSVKKMTSRMGAFHIYIYHQWNSWYAISRILVVHDVPGMQHSCAQCGRGDEHLWGGGRCNHIRVWGLQLIQFALDNDEVSVF